MCYSKRGGEAILKKKTILLFKYRFIFLYRMPSTFICAKYYSTVNNGAIDIFISATNERTDLHFF